MQTICIANELISMVNKLSILQKKLGLNARHEINGELTFTRHGERNA